MNKFFCVGLPLVGLITWGLIPVPTAHAGAFTDGNLAITVADASANNTTCSVVELNTVTAGQTPVQTIAIPGTGANAIRVSGSASSTLYAANSDDGTLFCFTGANSTDTSANGNTLNPRAVVTLNSAGTLAIPATYTGGSGNQTRGASTADNATWYFGDQGGIYTNGSSKLVNSNFRAVKSFGGALYVLQSSATTIVVNTLSADGKTVAGLPGLALDANATDFCLISSGSNGSTFDVLYTIGSDGIKKYSLVSGTWAANATNAQTGFAICAKPGGGGAMLYVTTGSGATTANSVLKLTDPAGYNAAIAVNALNNVTLYTTGAGTLIKGIAFAPANICTPPATPVPANNGPLNAGSTLNLSTPSVVNGTYQWSGPNGFSSTNQNPSITNVSVLASGVYSVTASAGDCTSAAGQTTVTINGAPVILSFAPTNLWAYPNQTATFTVSAFANPAPQYQWMSNSVALVGETGPTLRLPVTDTNQNGTIVSVVVGNSFGSNTLNASLIVTPKPNLRITEVMSSENTNHVGGSTTNNSDWWELSNLGTFPVNLQGFRFDDNHNTFADAVTLTNNVSIAPGEIIILVENMTAAQFQAWWGATNLPANLQLITFPRIGFSSAGDEIYFWNAAATNESDYLDAVSFSAATRGYTFTADTNGLNFDGNTLSVSNVPPAFTAPIGNDIGSPGYITTPVVVLPPNPPTITNVHVSGGGADISWTTQTNYHYAVAFKVKLTDASWTVLTNITATGATLNFHDGAATNATRFYRITATP